MLGLEQLDLFLMHWPVPTLYDGDFVSTWNAMTELHGGPGRRLHHAGRCALRNERTCRTASGIFSGVSFHG
jgi:hypothetical protein